MKFNVFKQRMQKKIFTINEARLIAFKEKSNVIKLQLSQWQNRGELLRLKRGIYAFSDYKPAQKEVIAILYPPAYISLESALNAHGLMPDVTFATTLVTTKPTHTFKTPLGTFIYHKIKSSAFFGFDPEALMAEKEKALIDYFYLNSKKLIPKNAFWDSMRFQNLNTINFKIALKYARYFKSKKLINLLSHFKQYAKSH